MLLKTVGTQATVAAITYLVERMIESGRLRRESDPADRRKVILALHRSPPRGCRGVLRPVGHAQHAAMADPPDSDLSARLPWSGRWRQGSSPLQS